MKTSTVECRVQAFWILIWQPCWYVFAVPRIFGALGAWEAALLMIYGVFAPMLIWLFALEPWFLRRERKREADHA